MYPCCFWARQTLWITLYLWLGAAGRIYCTPWRFALLRVCERDALGLLFPIQVTGALIVAALRRRTL
jgi:hypothetical protein